MLPGWAQINGNDDLARGDADAGKTSWKMINTHSQSATGQSAHGQSAKILQFPVGGRRGVAGHRPSADAAELMAQRVSDAVGAAWYHEAAIEESTAPAKS